MKIFVLLALIPSLIVADILCPNSKTTCPEDKQCCEIDGEYSCCDPDDDQDSPARRLKVYAGNEIMSSTSFANVSFSPNGSILHYGLCNSFSCTGTCCSSGSDGCCPYKMATCCGSYKCCPSLSKCCRDGCCGFLTSCCGDGCCDSGYNCCESWCCKSGYKCGKTFFSCTSKGVAISPAIVGLLMLAASVFVVNRF